MALKKENQEVTYSDRIGVNRGAGLILEQKYLHNKLML